MNPRRLALLLLLTSTPLSAQTISTSPPATRSAPQPLPITDSIPAARDVPYPGGAMTLEVDARDTARGIFVIKQRIPVTNAGPMVLLYPEWLPGNHAPRGPIEKLAGLHFSADGKPIAWKRDDVDVYAFHIVVPEGTKAIEASFQYLTPTAGDQGRIVMTPDMLNLQWNATALYPAGYFTRRIPVKATLTLPEGWTAATAMRPASQQGSVIRYQETDFETLVDAPVFAGRNVRQERLSDDVYLNIVADRPEQLAATPEQIAPHRNLVTQATKLFGAQHYDRYDFLLALSDRQGGIGLEHHRSSENGVGASYFTDWAGAVGDRDLLPHEYTHSWNGKFRRGADLFTPDFRTPMRNSLLWVYEGQTQFWGYVLAARSGLLTRAEALDALALVAGGLDIRTGRQWRPLIDTTDDPIMSARRPKGWTSWQRSEDYYNEGLLIWLDADSLIRQLSGGKRSLDDFARAFFGVQDRDWGQLPYRFEDVVATLDQVQPHDWTAFLRERLERPADKAPLDGFTRGGYRLAYTDQPTPFFSANEKDRKVTDLSWSGGLTLDNDGKISGVAWGSAAFDVGLTVGSQIISVNGRSYSGEEIKGAVKSAKGGRTGIRLLVKNANLFREVDLNWTQGLRYPRLQRSGGGAASLDALLTPLK